MSEPGPGNTEDAGESFVERWSRLKQRAHENAAPGTAPPSPAAAAPAPSSDVPAAPAAAPVVELPDLSQLGQDSDYSAFLTPGVDADLRRRALRQLFSSPKFNVCDGLDTYRDDFRNFAPLGDVVTADMRHHVERLARQAKQALEQHADAAPTEAAAPPPAPATDAQGPSADNPPPDTEVHLDHRPG